VPGQPFDPKEYWESVEKNRATMSTVVGDAFVIPMLEELDRAKEEGRSYDLRSLWVWVSSGVRWSAHLKERMLKYAPNCFVADAYGTTESGVANMSPVSAGMKAEDIPEHTTDVAIKMHGYGANHLVLDLDTGEKAKPGCKHAQFVFGGFMGVGYWKAPSKTKKDWTVIDG
jgi:fatty-acyl-CoA synthase